MPRRLATPSLRRSLLISALAVVAIASTAMLVAMSSMLALRNAIDRDANSFIEEQQIADQIAALTYQQQLAVYRYLQQPDASLRERVQTLGDDAAARMRQYLFHVLSPAARLQVERMRETHEEFEVSAHRLLDLAQRGELAAARARLRALDAQAATLDTAVTRFLDARVAQRTALLSQYHALTIRVRTGLVIVVVLLLALAVLLAFRLRRQVMGPLDQLASAAQLIREGDALARVPPQHYAEIRQVAQAFNEMADSVQLSRETVEMQNEELRQSLEQLQETQDALVQHEKLSAMGQMLAGLAHELNNPLGGVLGLAELVRSELAESPDPATRRIGTDLATPLEREAIRARDLVRSLLNFARKATGRVETLPLADTVNTALSLRAHAFVQAGKTLRADLPASLYVFADAQKLQQAVVNVVNNALDSIIDGNGHELAITARPIDESLVRIDFDDDGPGFQRVDAAFSPFYTTKPPDRGTGLGLSLVQKFIEEFGGSVAATNRPQGGARISMILRRASAPSSADVPTQSPITDAAPIATADTQARVPDSNLPRVLVVDDEPSLREVQRRLLTLEGMEVLVAASGREALDIIAREKLDLVVSDLRMPGDTDGLELLALLEKNHPELAARSLLVTGEVSTSATSHLLPAERLINKPFTRAEYVARVRRALGGLADRTSR